MQRSSTVAEFVAARGRKALDDTIGTIQAAVVKALSQCDITELEDFTRRDANHRASGHDPLERIFDVELPVDPVGMLKLLDLEGMQRAVGPVPQRMTCTADGDTQDIAFGADEERRAAARRLARGELRFPVYPRRWSALRRSLSPAMRDLKAGIASMTGTSLEDDDLIEDLVTVAILKAARSARARQPVRLHRRGAEVVPATLPAPEFRQWLSTRVEAEFLDEILPDRQGNDEVSIDDPEQSALRARLRRVQDPDPTPEARLVHEAALRRALGGLTAREREVFIRKYEGMSDSEIADDLGRAPSTVRVQLKSARERLKKT